MSTHEVPLPIEYVLNEKNCGPDGPDAAYQLLK